MWLKLILFSVTVIQIFGDPLPYDWSLKEACDKTGGTFTPRVNRQSIVGDKCDLKFKVATHDENDARDFCELYAPWRLISTKKEEIAGRFYTTCEVESTLICKEGWWQMFGHCFKVPDKMTYTREEAEKKCGAIQNGGYIAFMHHRYIVGMWRRYFPTIGQSWINATESFDQYIQKTNTVDGTALALAFTGKHYHFGVHANSLIRIDPNIKLHVICEYKPRITPAEINYLGRRYSEIYYQSVPVKDGILVRSASSYTRSSKNIDVCTEVLKPFLVDKVGPFDPNKEVLESMENHRPESTYLTRSGAEQFLDGNGEDAKRNDVICTKNHTYPSEWRVPVEGKLTADFKVNVTGKTDCENMLSSAITHFKGKRPQIISMSDSRSLPIWCKLGRPLRLKWTEPGNGYTTFERSNGEIIAHKLHVEPKKYYEDAKKVCESEGAVLAGFDSRKEADQLMKLAAASGQKDSQFWLGGRRREKCDMPAWDKNITSDCYRSRVIQWENNIADRFEFEESWWKNAPRLLNPDYAGKTQKCLCYVYGTPNWADPKSGGFLDDMNCEHNFGFFCSKKIDVVEVVEELD